MRQRWKLFVWMLTVSFGVSYAQEPLPREKVTVEYDRVNGCDLGDTIHFSAFVEREGHEGATDFSRVLYVELLNAAGNVIQRRKLPLEGGRAEGKVWVDSLYGSGFYELRAYTRYMTNWKSYGYWSRLLPVYLKLKEGESGDVRRLNLEAPRMVSNSLWKRMVTVEKDTIYGVEQPIERHLMVFGHIEPRKKHPTVKEWNDRGNRRMKVAIYQGKKVLMGDAVTDSMGCYALYFPDVKGEWNMKMLTPKVAEVAMGERVVTKQHVVAVDGLFAPVPRVFPAEAFEPMNFGKRKWKDDVSGRKYERCFLDGDVASLNMNNSGSISSSFYAFLSNSDGRFERATGYASPIVQNVTPDTVCSRAVDLNLPGKDSNDPRTVCVDGVSFEGRPIVWIVDGAYRMVTGLSKRITDFEVLRPTKKSLPQYLDEVRNVYFTNDPAAFYPYVRCSVLEKKKPITVFVTLRKGYVWDDSGLMCTFFDGFSTENEE
ncbi:MAG: hypothetical protein IJ693_10960 [Bacteroidaceae bacterium]|nr:hypothetical protein [Bacteroidaceae bacterium]